MKSLSAQKISPEGKPKVQLQIVLHDISSYTFHFCTPEGRDKQIAERNKVKVRFTDFITLLLSRCKISKRKQWPLSQVVNEFLSGTITLRQLGV